MIALSCKHVFQSSQFYLTSLTPRLDLKPLATLEPLPSWFKQRDKACCHFGEEHRAHCLVHNKDCVVNKPREWLANPGALVIAHAGNSCQAWSQEGKKGHGRLTKARCLWQLGSQAASTCVKPDRRTCFSRSAHRSLTSKNASESL